MKQGQGRSVDSYKYIYFFKSKDTNFPVLCKIEIRNRSINEINRYGAAVFSTVSSKQDGSGLVDSALNEAGINWFGFTLSMQKAEELLWLEH